MISDDWVARLGFTPEVRAWFEHAPHEDARRALEAIKTEAKRLYRQYARELHPDLGGDGEELRRLNVARDLIFGLSVVEPALEEQPARVVAVSGNWVRL